MRVLGKPWPASPAQPGLALLPPGDLLRLARSRDELHHRGDRPMDEPGASAYRHGTRHITHRAVRSNAIRRTSSRWDYHRPRSRAAVNPLTRPTRSDHERKARLYCYDAALQGIIRCTLDECPAGRGAAVAAPAPWRHQTRGHRGDRRQAARGRSSVAAGRYVGRARVGLAHDLAPPRPRRRRRSGILNSALQLSNSTALPLHG